MQSRETVSLIYLTRRVRTQSWSAFIIKPNGWSPLMAHCNCFVGTHFSFWCLCSSHVYFWRFGEGLKGRSCAWIKKEFGFKCAVQLATPLPSPFAWLLVKAKLGQLKRELMMSSHPGSHCKTLLVYQAASQKQGLPSKSREKNGMHERVICLFLPVGEKKKCLWVFSPPPFKPHTHIYATTVTINSSC